MKLVCECGNPQCRLLLAPYGRLDGTESYLNRPSPYRCPVCGWVWDMRVMDMSAVGVRCPECAHD